jgi:serine/threonine protein kinase
MRREEEIFHRTLDLPPEERHRFLDHACGGNATLRAAVESLLAADSRVPKAFLAGADSLAEVDLAPGTLVGGYEVLRFLGAGGMGRVYEARQATLQRSVALKILRPAEVSRDEVRRFRQEAAVLARLQHPGIAQIHEAGTAEVTDERGRTFELAFYAMELVHGRRLSDHASEQRLDLRSRLELIARVCDAAHHAHVRGIIHRDLKAENVLVVPEEPEVTGRDGSRLAPGQPKILDFGIARVVGERADAVTRVTRQGVIVGTLASMSPEQVRGEHPIDERADVYALGVLLFWLLASRPPLDLAGCAITEAIRRICEEEPPRLSSIDPSLRGDVTVIAGRAMHKERARRYASAAELASDLRRSIRGEPIAARSESALELLRRNARRHKAAFFVAFTALVVLGAAVPILWVQLAANRDLARRESEARRRSDADYAKVLEAVDLLTRIGADDLREVPKAQTARRRLLERALEVHEALLTERGTDPVLLERQAQSRLRVGEILADLGKGAEALRELRVARTSLATLSSRSAVSAMSEIRCLVLLGRASRDLGELGDAEEALEQACALALELLGSAADPVSAAGAIENSHRHLANLFVVRGQPASAARCLHASLEVLEKLSAGHPREVRIRRNVVDTLTQLGNAWKQMYRPADADRVWSRALELARELAAAVPSDTSDRYRVALLSMNVSTVCERAGRQDEALALRQEAVRIGEDLVSDHPLTALYRSLLLDAHTNLANELSQSGDLGRAAASALRAVDLGTQAQRDSPESASSQSSLATAEVNAGRILRLNGDLERARELLEGAARHFEAASNLQPEWQHWAQGLRHARLNLASVHVSRGQPEDARLAISALPGLTQPLEATSALEVLSAAIEDVERNPTLPSDHRSALVHGLVGEAEALLRRSFVAGVPRGAVGGHEAIGRLGREASIQKLLQPVD